MWWVVDVAVAAEWEWCAEKNQDAASRDSGVKSSGDREVEWTRSSSKSSRGIFIAKGARTHSSQGWQEAHGHIAHYIGVGEMYCSLFQSFNCKWYLRSYYVLFKGSNQQQIQAKAAQNYCTLSTNSGTPRYAVNRTTTCLWLHSESFGPKIYNAAVCR